MKKVAFAAAMLAATAFSGSALALAADAAKGLQISNDAVKIYYRHTYHPYYHRRCSGCGANYVVESCGCGCRIAYWNWGASRYWFSRY